MVERDPPKVIVTICNAKNAIDHENTQEFDSWDAWEAYIAEHGPPLLEEGAYIAIYVLHSIGEIETTITFAETS